MKANKKSKSSQPHYSNYRVPSNVLELIVPRSWTRSTFSLNMTGTFKQVRVFQPRIR